MIIAAIPVLSLIQTILARSHGAPPNLGGWQPIADIDR